MHGREPDYRGRDLDEPIMMFVSPNAAVGLGGEREDWMLHRGHVPLGRGIEEVTDEKVRCRIPVGKEWRTLVFRYFTHHGTSFDISHTSVKGASIFHTRGFDILHTDFRYFTHKSPLKKGVLCNHINLLDDNQNQVTHSLTTFNTLHRSRVLWIS